MQGGCGMSMKAPHVARRARSHQLSNYCRQPSRSISGAHPEVMKWREGCTDVCGSCCLNDVRATDLASLSGMKQSASSQERSNYRLIEVQAWCTAFDCAAVSALHGPASEL